MILFLKKQAFQTIKMSFRHSRKNWHISKGVNPRFSSKIQNFFRVCLFLKRAQICIFMMLFIKKKAFQTLKMSFAHRRKNCIYPPGVNLRFWSIPTFFFRQHNGRLPGLFLPQLLKFNLWLTEVFVVTRAERGFHVFALKATILIQQFLSSRLKVQPGRLTLSQDSLNLSI